jgi:hypothetical protein
MTELHYALIGAAVALLVLLAVWSKWQERRQLRRMENLSASAETGAAKVESKQSAGRIEPRLGPVPGETTAEPAEAAAQPPRLPGWTEDPMLDCVVELRCAHAADGVAVIDAVAPLARLDCGLPVHTVAFDARAEQWVLPDRFGFYGELLASIQLATRTRRLGDIEASRFIAAAQQAAMALDADFDPPDVALLRRRAEALETLVAQFDVQIGLTVQPADGVFTAPQVENAALAMRLEPDGERRWLRRGDGGQALFSLRLDDDHRLVLELDVPSVDPTARPLQAMFAAAAELAVLLNARVVDDRGRPVAPGSIEAIEPALQKLYEQMRAADISAGSERARRLFS